MRNPLGIPGRETMPQEDFMGRRTASGENRKSPGNRMDTRFPGIDAKNSPPKRRAVFVQSLRFD